MIGVIALVVVVALVAVFLVMGRRGKADPVPGEEAPEAPVDGPPQRRPLPPPPPPPKEEFIPGSPLEELDNPYYNYDYGPGVDDPPRYGDDQDPGYGPEVDPGSEPLTDVGGPEGPVEETYDPSPRTDG
jgi:hypothetical protein